MHTFVHKKEHSTKLNALSYLLYLELLLSDNAF